MVGGSALDAHVWFSRVSEGGLMNMHVCFWNWSAHLGPLGPGRGQSKKLCRRTLIPEVGFPEPSHPATDMHSLTHTHTHTSCSRHESVETLRAGACPIPSPASPARYAITPPTHLTHTHTRTRLTLAIRRRTRRLLIVFMSPDGDSASFAIISSITWVDNYWMSQGPQRAVVGGW